jgi:EAL domain-containing protein (putative c-di-GMP-specific phosphodiesterase class I)
MSRDTPLRGRDAWFLEGYAEEDRGLVRTPVRPLPFRVGRRPELGLTLPSVSVSQEHAEIFAEGACLWVRDLGSTNGTFLNRQRVQGAAPLEEGDILHFADREFRLVRDSVPVETSGSGTVELRQIDLPRRLAGSTRELRLLIETRAILPLFQPIVRLADGQVAAYETLCRGAFEGLPEQPAELFALAASVGLDQELSRAVRQAAAGAARSLATAARLFFNTHPGELGEPAALLASLEALGHLVPLPAIVLEIHEGAVTDLGAMRELRRALSHRGIGLAYDDFGAGQARLVELAEVPPDYLKFDIALIRELDRATGGRRRMLASLVEMARELGIVSLAEGIERPAEAAAARDLGFELAQGYLFGRPEPAPAG